MKLKHKFVSPRVTQSVRVYLESDVLQIPTGSTMYDQTAVSAGQMTKSLNFADGNEDGYGAYWE